MHLGFLFWIFIVTISNVRILLAYHSLILSLALSSTTSQAACLLKFMRKKFPMWVSFPSWSLTEPLQWDVLHCAWFMGMEEDTQTQEGFSFSWYFQSISSSENNAICVENISDWESQIWVTLESHRQERVLSAFFDVHWILEIAWELNSPFKKKISVHCYSIKKITILCPEPRNLSDILCILVRLLPWSTPVFPRFG